MEENVLNQDDITVNKVIKAEDIAKMTGTGSSTIRKYCLALEKFGYVFKKENNLMRVFEKRDVEALERLIMLRKRSGISVDNAASIVANSIDNDGTLLPMQELNLDAGKGALEKKMFLDFQEQIESTLALMQQAVEMKMGEETRALKNEVILMRESLEKKLLESEPKKDDSFDPDLLQEFSNTQVENQQKLLQENEQMKKEIADMKKQTVETNRLLSELLKEKEIKESVMKEQQILNTEEKEAEKPEARGFFKKLFGSR